VINQNFSISYTASADPQVNAIWIFRTADGGGLFYFLASVANTTSTYTDSLPDASLNNLIVAPVGPLTMLPCPAGASLVTWFDGRPLVASKNMVYWAQGPQTTTGVGEQSFQSDKKFLQNSPSR